MSKKRTEYYLVKLTRPTGVSVQDMEDYIETWVASGCGSKHPDDPMFKLSDRSVVAKRATPSRLQVAILEEKGEVSK